MGGVNLTTLMDGVATALSTLCATGNTAHAWPNEDAVAGDFVVGYPTDPQAVAATFGRGLDRVSLPVYAICGLPQDKTTRDAVALQITGASSVVTTLEGTLSGAVSSCVVRDWQVDRFDPINREPLVAVRYNLDILT